MAQVFMNFASYAGSIGYISFPRFINCIYIYNEIFFNTTISTNSKSRARIFSSLLLLLNKILLVLIFFQSSLIKNLALFKVERI